MSGTLIQQQDAQAWSNQDLEAKVSARTAELRQLNAELGLQARTEALTRLANRLRTNERLAEEFARFKRIKMPYSVLVLDIDFFNRVNDTHRHAIGDCVFRDVATALRGTIPKTDFGGYFLVDR